MRAKILIWLGLVGCGLAGALDLRLPTGNQELFSDPSRFYMHVDRTFEGKVSKPWEGGCYGYVRNPIRVDGQEVLTKFHEGIDIAPLQRDSAGNPQDLIMSIAAGKVVHVSSLPGRSNYGRYIVVEHTWEGSAIYSLYAHLAEIRCEVGDAVNAGSVIGKMGFSGSGLDRERAHLHLELGFMLSEHFDEWYKAGGHGANDQGLFNGMNLSGLDVGAFYLAHRANSEIRLSEFMAATPVAFKVTVPCKGVPEFVQRYAWLRRGAGPAATGMWEISFSSTGVPLAFAVSERQVDSPVVTAIAATSLPYTYHTRRLVVGQGSKVGLSQAGRRLMMLLTDDLPPGAVAKERTGKPQS